MLFPAPRHGADGFYYQPQSLHQPRAERSMPLYWLVYRHNNQISVVIEPWRNLRRPSAFQYFFMELYLHLLVQRSTGIVL